MPHLIESTDYDRFEYKHFDEPALALDEAIRVAARLRDSDQAHFHRIVPVDSEATTFRIDSIPRDATYAQLLGRWTELLNKFISRSTTKRQA
jgi:hypothetical protein